METSPSSEYEIFPVILCGGVGSRLWPLSRSAHPKQFIRFGEHSLLEDTLERCRTFSPEHLLVVGNEDHRFLLLDTVKDDSSAEILLEPAGRNTAPAVALAAFRALELYSGEGREAPLLLVLPSDHHLHPASMLTDSVQRAARIAQQGYLVTFGITPDSPATGFGYIIGGESLGEGLQRVERFQEKPDLATAKQLLAGGQALWNSGMFLFRADSYLSELKLYAPEMYAQVEKAWREHTQDHRFLRPEAELFKSCTADSIDYAIMEHTVKAAVCPMEIEWSDLGSWEALYQRGPQDENGNTVCGDVCTDNAHNCYLHSTGRLLAAVGVDDLAVVETSDAVLVIRRDRAQDVKHIVEKLKAAGRAEQELHPRVYRPWGRYEGLAREERFQVKRIEVKPGGELSLQKHYHRSEHWVVVQGTAEVTLDGETRLVTENESVYIPLGSTHRLKNPGILPLELIEIQTGSYLGEDDIVRLDDIYGRVTPQHQK